MTIKRSKNFAKDYQRLPQKIQQKAERQLRMLITDWRHPSLSAKKMKGHPDIWKLGLTASIALPSKWLMTH